MFRQRLQLGMIHVAVAMTLVPINSTLNRVMIKELLIPATLVAVLASLPYLFSPIQVAIGGFSDRHPLWGRRRTPYILLGLGLCVTGVLLAPLAAFTLAENRWGGLLFAALAFGAWGMGSNFATVSYLALASELSGEKGRSRTIAVMWFMMISGIILTAITLSRLLDPYSGAALYRAFGGIAAGALVLGLLGIWGLEPPHSAGQSVSPERVSWVASARAVATHPQARRFFAYLILLLAAILGQDILLEPFAAEAFGLPVNATTRITSIWGGCVLGALLLAGLLERRLPKRRIAALGGLGAMIAFGLIAISGWEASKSLFYAAVMLLGLSTGLSTVSNLSLMLDMTLPGRAGLMIGAWGMADALARGLGAIVSGVVRDLVTQFAHTPVGGYMAVFGLEALMLAVSLLLLGQVDSGRFRQEAEKAVEPLNVIERVALAND